MSREKPTGPRDPAVAWDPYSPVTERTCPHGRYTWSRTDGNGVTRGAICPLCVAEMACLTVGTIVTFSADAPCEVHRP